MDENMEDGIPNTMVNTTGDMLPSKRKKKRQEQQGNEVLHNN